jgi:pimeloyl-ACP methyl ester carboxylesterase
MRLRPGDSRHASPATRLRAVIAVAICLALMSGNVLTAAAVWKTPPRATPSVDSRGTTSDGTGYTQVDGKKAGALFRGLRPDDWNGRLILLLHGAVHPSEPVQLPPPGHEPLWSNLIDRLVSEGYGVAFSSYRVNGLALQEGVIDSRVAHSMFSSAFGKPDATYLVGISMGTSIGQKLVETSPARYDGFLAICSALGGATLQETYLVNARILFDYYFPDALPGNVWDKTDLDFGSVVFPAVLEAIGPNAGPEAFQRAVELASIDQLDIAWSTPDELMFGIALSLAVRGGGTGDFQAKTGGIAVDNTDTLYTGSADDIALNAGVERFSADPNAERFLQRFDPTGKLNGTPVLALHTTRDPIVPHHFHFPAYQAVLAETGNQHLFHTRLIDRFGHCSLSTDEVFGAFQDLETWADTGTPPQQ